MSIYEQLGREVGIRAAVGDFYERVLADPALTPYFDGVDLNRLRGHQTKLLVQVTGGPASYDGRELADAHRGLSVTGPDFDRVVAHLAATLSGLGVDEPTIGDVAAALGGYREDIVDSPAAAAAG